MELNDRNKQRLLDFIVKQDDLDIRVGDFEGKSFLIVGGWSTVSNIHAAINAEFSHVAWAQWRHAYESKGGRRPYDDLRLGNVVPICPNEKCVRRDAVIEVLPGHWRCYHCGAELDFDGYKSPIRYDIPGAHVAPYYQVPDGLIELGDVVEWGFSDEYDLCSECARVVRTSPDSYGWTPEFWLDEYYGLLCQDCVKENHADEYLAHAMGHSENGKPRTCNLINPEDHQFRRVLRGLENGLHPGQNSDPRPIVQWARKRDLQVVFTYTPGQFDVNFDVHMRVAGDDHDDLEAHALTDKEVEEIREALVECSYEYGGDTLRHEFRQWPDPATLMERGLRAASQDGVRFATIHGDGTYTAYASVED